VTVTVLDAAARGVRGKLPAHTGVTALTFFLGMFFISGNEKE
jgi:hypothetical protein